MNLYAFVRPGTELVSQKEIQEVCNVNSIIHNSVLEFDVKNKEDIVQAVYHLQSVRRLVFSLGKYQDIESINFNSVQFPWKDIFSKTCSCKVDVEGVKGQDNRITIAKNVLSSLLPTIEQKCGFTPNIDVKNPSIIISVFHNGDNYFIGIDMCGKELDARFYRVFPHSGSFKGDLAYYFVRKSGFSKGEQLLIGFVKDGALVIEAAILESTYLVQDITQKDLSLFSFPLFHNFDFDQVISNPTQDNNKNIFAFDESTRNHTAARKNIKIAGVSSQIEISKHDIDDLDVRYSKDQFNRLIFHVTTKDEERINEIYYQASYVLQKKGTLLFIGRENWDVSVSEKFTLIEKEEIVHGKGKYVLWLLEKK